MHQGAEIHSLQAEAVAKVAALGISIQCKARCTLQKVHETVASDLEQHRLAAQAVLEEAVPSCNTGHCRLTADVNG